MSSIVKTLSILILAAGLTVLCMPNNLPAREWSEPIRLTDTQGDWMPNDYFCADVDGQEYIHVLYRVEQDHGIGNRNRTYYAQFDSKGRGIIEPMYLLGDTAGCYQYFYVENNGTVHILGLMAGEDTLRFDNTEYFYCVLDGGMYVIEPTLIPGMYHGWFDAVVHRQVRLHAPQMDMLSDGTFVFVSLVAIPIDLENLLFDYSVVYTRFDPDEMQMIDSTHIVSRHRWDRDNGPLVHFRNLHMTTDENDNLYIAWSIWDGLGHHTPYLAKVDRADSIHYVDSDIPSIAAFTQVDYIAADEEGGLYLARPEQRFDNGNFYVYFQKILPDGSHGYFVEPGIINHYWVTKSIITLGNGMAFIFNQRPIGDDVGSRAYYLSFRLSDGEIIDSLQLFGSGFQSTQYSYMYYRNDNLYLIYCLVNNEAEGVDIHMIRTIDGEGVVREEITPSSSSYDLRCNPNPFNDQTSIQFTMVNSVDVTLSVFDVQGREIGRKRLGNTEAGNHSISTSSFIPQDLSSGVYVLKFDVSGTVRKSIKLVKIN